MNIGELILLLEKYPQDILVVAQDMQNDDEFAGIYIKEVKIDNGIKDRGGNYHYYEAYAGQEAICITTRQDI